ncbi:hypothetical protein MNBD_GAMMA06-1915 [hydrothermal vent metagenome]|uniref:Uncharacterized protein n=1 Tax=hydrothermal vent metagenome TaxID=652676 RepID=A0A3B0WR11_9ZZZZ
MKNLKPLIGISRCLLGDAVRYDGQSKANQIILEQLATLFKFVPICPEVEAGLSIPRPPVQLTGSIKNPKLTGRDNFSIDVTDIMQNYCNTKPAKLNHLSGFIFKSHSPSCGLNSTPVFINGRSVTETSRGIFAKRLCETYPKLLVIEDTELNKKTQLNRFIQTVLDHH